jgi:peptidylprolyl isomerase
MRGMNGRTLALTLCAAMAIAGCGGGGGTSKKSTAPASGATTTTTPPKRSKPHVRIPKGSPPKKLVIKDLIKGNGRAAQSGHQVTVQYVGVNYKTGKQFDATWDRGQPFPFQLGAGQVIRGWDEGVAGMRVGGRRELIIPPRLAYGPQGQPPAIGRNATLVFVIDLLGVQ